jgi:hypothetical protein
LISQLELIMSPLNSSRPPKPFKVSPPPSP